MSEGFGQFFDVAYIVCKNPRQEKKETGIAYNQ